MQLNFTLCSCRQPSRTPIFSASFPDMISTSDFDPAPFYHRGSFLRRDVTILPDWRPPPRSPCHWSAEAITAAPRSRRRRRRSRSRPKPPVTPFDHLGPSTRREARAEARVRSGLRAGERAGGRGSACTDFVGPAGQPTCPRARPRPRCHRLPQRQSARSLAVSSLTFPPSTTAARPFFRPPSLAPSPPSSARLPRLSKFCRSFNSSFVVRQPRERLQQCDAPPSSLLAATKVRSRSDLLLATIKTLDT